MEIINFWIILIGLISNLVLGLVAISKRNSKILKKINIALGIFIITFYLFNYYSERENIEIVKEEIVAFLNEQHHGYETKTLTEITIYLKRRDYKEATYSKAIVSLLKEKRIVENTYNFQTGIQEHKCYIYKLSK